MTDLQVLILALLQGVSELFPISSLGHTILVPALLHWTNVDRSNPTFLAFVVILHLGTALALIVYYRARWLAIVRALVASVVRGRLSADRDERIGWLLVVGTIPVGILGVIFEEPVRALFGSPAPAALFLALNGLIMFGGEALKRRRRGDVPIEDLSFPQSALVGVAQSFALLPGISRSGASMVAGLLCNLDHEDAAEFSFLLATPVIFAAALLETRYLGDTLPRGSGRARRAVSSDLRWPGCGSGRVSVGCFLDALFQVERSTPVRLVLPDRRRSLLYLE